MPLSTLAKNTKRVGSSLNSIKRVTPYTGNVVHGKILFKKIGKQQNNFINNNLKLIIIRFVKNANDNNVNNDDVLKGLATLFNGLSENIKNNIFKLLIDNIDISNVFKDFKDNVEKFNITYTEGSLEIKLEVGRDLSGLIFDGEKQGWWFVFAALAGAVGVAAGEGVLRFDDANITRANAAVILTDIKDKLSEINFY